MDRETFAHEGITFTYKDEHGGWYADPEQEAEGTLCMAANVDGSPAIDTIGEIEWSYYAAGGMCEAACDLCASEHLKWEVLGF